MKHILKNINWEEGFKRLFILGIAAYWVWLIVISWSEGCYPNIFDGCDLLIWFILGGIVGSLYGFKLLKYIVNIIKWVFEGFSKK